ncbi:MAG: helix-turn-helix domain-containing protein [Rubrobacter sp.]|nr:helix-turn-helix domain-containing protein [Rubrobacter sp.]
MDNTLATYREVMAEAARIVKMLSPTWLKAKEAAANIGIDYRRLYELAAKKEMPSYRVGPQGLRFKKSDLDYWVRTNSWNN